ncbi:NAD-dependent deacylase [Pleionea litopenaei]|uniref:NAD-dependent protein deacylase n=1 Tax=Pleionea litopenaei TaxID=3070815 RepID=A0AA51RQN8_9GAMM|nr:NAD-dependent deacylase [Pleionea sp. HL-JVS1]WMS85699.1 NAD-dependent deacylase [Pleionea sp. HL-JVS1]
MLKTQEKMLMNLYDTFMTAKRLVVMTGAGVSAESGIATFRGDQDSYWSRFDPYQLASAEGFIEAPQRVWDWYQWRRSQVGAAQPNAAHYGLAELAQSVPLFLITQNVDGLHHRAGSQQVCELHGRLMMNRCFNPSCGYREDAIDFSAPLITCPRCQSAYLRPDVVWFGESLSASSIQQSEAATTECDVFVSIGTSAQVYPAAGFAQIAAASGAQLIEINPEATALTSQVDWVIAEPAGKVFEGLRSLLK